jgi:hypothetical protein
MHPSWVRQEKLIASYFWAQQHRTRRKVEVKGAVHCCA